MPSTSQLDYHSSLLNLLGQAEEREPDDGAPNLHSHSLTKPRAKRGKKKAPESDEVNPRSPTTLAFYPPHIRKILSTAKGLFLQTTCRHGRYLYHLKSKLKNDYYNFAREAIITASRPNKDSESDLESSADDDLDGVGKGKGKKSKYLCNSS